MQELSDEIRETVVEGCEEHLVAKEQQIPGRSRMSHDELAVSVAPK